MATQNTAAAIQRTIDSKFDALKAAIDKAITVYGVGGDIGQRKEAFVPIYTFANILYEILAPQDRPRWLTAIRQAAVQFKGSPSSSEGTGLLQTIIKHSPEIEPIRLVEETLEEFNFDGVFERLREKHHLPEIFDRLAAELTKIIESGEVDSVVTMAALQRMVAALRANREGSLSSIEVTFSYTRFAWNYIGELMKRIPGVEEFAVAVEKTMEEGEAEMASLRDDMRDEALAALVESIPNIKRIPQYAAQVPLIRHNNQREAEDVVDGEFEVKAH